MRDMKKSRRPGTRRGHHPHRRGGQHQRQPQHEGSTERPQDKSVEIVHRDEE